MYFPAGQINSVPETEYRFCIISFMFSVWNKTLQEIRETTASASPFATSVAISIISAVNACALLEMTMMIAAEKLNEGNKGKTSDRRQEAGIVGSQVINIRAVSDTLAALADEDIRIFQTVLGSGSLKKNTRHNTALKEITILRSIRIPLQAAEEIMRVFPLINACAGKCPRNLLSDLPAAANLLEAAIKNLVLAIDANTKALQPSRRSNILESANRLLSYADSATQKISRETAVLYATVD